MGLGVGSEKMELTNKITGYFDVKVYNSKTDKANWKTKGEDEQISFTATFPELKKEFEKYAKPYTNKDGVQRFAVQFKIGSKCRWFDEYAKQVVKPTNESLDKKRFEVVIQYNQLDGDPAQKEASGYWVNAIQFKEFVENPFTAFEPRHEAQPFDPIAAAPAAPAAPETEKDLPF